MIKAYGNYETQWKTNHIMGIPEEEKETGTESICKALWLKTCQTWGEKWTSRSINTPNR